MFWLGFAIGTGVSIVLMVCGFYLLARLDYLFGDWAWHDILIGLGFVAWLAWAALVPGV